MRNKILTIFAIMAILTVGLVAAKPALAETQAWGGTINAAVTEALVVKSGDTVLPDGYQFQPVSMKVGETKVYNLSVTNTGTVATFLVKPIGSSGSPDVTISWTNQAGLSLAPGDSGSFILTLTAVKANPNVVISVGFTRE